MQPLSLVPIGNISDVCSLGLKVFLIVLIAFNTIWKEKRKNLKKVLRTDTEREREIGEREVRCRVERGREREREMRREGEREIEGKRREITRRCN